MPVKFVLDNSIMHTIDKKLVKTYFCQILKFPNFLTNHIIKFVVLTDKMETIRTPGSINLSKQCLFHDKLVFYNVWLNNTFTLAY